MCKSVAHAAAARPQCPTSLKAITHPHSPPPDHVSVRASKTAPKLRANAVSRSASSGDSWAIVSDPTGTSGSILTRDQFPSEAEYDALVSRAYQLGVRGTITPTAQYPTVLSFGKGF